MKEDLLQFIWQFRLFEQQGLRSLQGEAISVLQPGSLNTHSGPDFLDAKVRIGETTWVGNVEIHLKTSDWFHHGHQADPAYENIILHVVLEHDLKNKKLENERPILVLNNKINRSLLVKYAAMMKSKNKIPCYGLLHTIEPVFISIYFQRLIVERLQQKSLFIKELLEQYSGDWTEVSYILTARYFGFSTNSKPFEQLARSLPLRLIAKHRISTLQVEALLFGNAGFLNEDLEDQYAQALWNEYQYLNKLYKLQPMRQQAWKMMRMRPSNFPTIRISQFANLMVKSESLFSKIIETKNIDKLKSLFDTAASDYWNEHFMFDKAAPKSKKHIGQGSKENLLINVVAPILFQYGATVGDDDFKDRAMELLSTLKPEKNIYSNQWMIEKIEMNSALDSQAALYLSQNYCRMKRCLKCAIGNKIMSV